MTSENLDLPHQLVQDLKTAERAFFKEHRIEKLPLVGDEGRLSGLITIKDIEK